MRHTYYQLPTGDFAAIDHDIKVEGQLKDVILVGWGPEPGRGIRSVGEQAYGVNEVAKWTPVAVQDVPVEWIRAIGLDEAEAAPDLDETCLVVGAVTESQAVGTVVAGVLFIVIYLWLFGI